MSPQDTKTLQDFLDQLTQVRGIAKDPQAEAMIASAVAQQPDAAYLLTQRALLVEQALAGAKAQIATLQAQLQAAQAGNTARPGFLDSNAWGNAAGNAARPAPVAPPTAPAAAPGAAAPGATAPGATASNAYSASPQSGAVPFGAAPSSGFFGGGLGSTLGTVAATAAGVAGGAFLFQGIEHLINGNSGPSGHASAASAPVENTTVNNYYGNEGEHDRSRNAADGADGGGDSGSSNDLAELSDIDPYGADNGDDDSLV